MRVWPVRGRAGIETGDQCGRPATPQLSPANTIPGCCPPLTTAPATTTPLLNRRLLTNNIIEDIYRNKAIENDLENILSVHFT